MALADSLAAPAVTADRTDVRAAFVSLYTRTSRSVAVAALFRILKGQHPINQQTLILLRYYNSCRNGQPDLFHK